MIQHFWICHSSFMEFKKAILLILTVLFGHIDAQTSLITKASSSEMIFQKFLITMSVKPIVNYMLFNLQIITLVLVFLECDIANICQDHLYRVAFYDGVILGGKTMPSSGSFYEPKRLKIRTRWLIFLIVDSWQLIIGQKLHTAYH